MKDKVQMWKLNIAKKLKESEANIKENWINTKIEVLEMLRRWEEKSSFGYDDLLQNLTRIKVDRMFLKSVKRKLMRIRLNSTKKQRKIR